MPETAAICAASHALSGPMLAISLTMHFTARDASDLTVFMAPIQFCVPAIASSVEPPVNAITLSIQTCVDAIAFTVQTPINAIALTVDASIDAVTLMLQLVGEPVFPGLARPVGPRIVAGLETVTLVIESIIDAVALVIEAPIDAITLAVETPVNAIAFTVEALIETIARWTERLLGGIRGPRRHFVA